MSSTAHIALLAHGAETRRPRQLVAWSYLPSPSLMLMVGEAERRDRFGYALQQALIARRMSERQLAQRLEVDPRKVARWRAGKGLPDLYETQALVSVLRVSEELFRNPPPVPRPAAYPIERYLVDAVGQGAAEGLLDEPLAGEGDDERDEPLSPPPR